MHRSRSPGSLLAHRLGQVGDLPQGLEQWQRVGVGHPKAGWAGGADTGGFRPDPGLPLLDFFARLESVAPGEGAEIPRFEKRTARQSG